MTKEREALKLALEALELEDMACRYEKDPTPEHIAKAITAIREALAQPEQEPVACVGTNGELMWLNKSKVIYSKPIPLYTTPPSNSMNSIKSSNTLDAQRKPLTKTRVGNYLRRHVNGDVGMYRNGFKDGVRFAEAAHGIKE